MLDRQISAFLKADAGLLGRIKYHSPFLHEDGLQKHLGRVLHMKHHARCSTIVIAGIECGDSSPKRAERFDFQRARLAP
jgi:hypothetical protein